MHGTFTAPTRVVVRHVQGLDCPKCSSPVYRVPRRVLDRLLSAFRPVRRYHCRSMVCGWEGNLSDTGAQSKQGKDGKPGDAMPQVD